VTLGPNETLDLSQDLMRLGRVRHLPVVDEVGQLVGIVSNRDLLEASLSKTLDFEPSSRRAFLRSVEVREVMTKEVVTIEPEASLEEAARLLVRRQIGCLPVVRPDGTLLGLLTETDLLRAAFLGEEGAETDKQEGSTIDMSTDARDFSDWIRGEIDDLRRMRDELNVQAHLARAELRDGWEQLEKGIRDLEQHGKRVVRAAEEPLRELEADARKLARDLRDGFRRIRDAV
jgi:CBS domain-containing protein